MMPFYGDVGQFRDAVRSVLEQTHDAWRLVVIDDCYPGTAHLDVIAAIDDPRVSMVRNPRNLGVAATFQRAVDLAEAPYLVIMGCDDLMGPDYIARMHELTAEHPEAAYFQPGVRVIDDDSAEVLPLADRVKGWYRPARGRPYILSGEDLARSLLRGNWTYFPSILWRREVITPLGFRPEFEVVLDLALQLDIATSGGSLVVDDPVTFAYRRHRSSVSSATAVSGARFEEERRFFDEIEQRCRALGWNAAARAAHHHWSSRLNALTRMPAALSTRDGNGIRVLAAHAARTTPRGSEPSGRR